MASATFAKSYKIINYFRNKNSTYKYGVYDLAYPVVTVREKRHLGNVRET